MQNSYRSNGTQRNKRVWAVNRQAATLAMSNLLGRKWHAVILLELQGADGVRFTDLQSRIDDISCKMLSESLDRLEEEYGLVEREVVCDQPLHVEYSLTGAGESLQPLLNDIVEWATVHNGHLDTD